MQWYKNHITKVRSRQWVKPVCGLSNCYGDRHKGLLFRRKVKKLLLFLSLLFIMSLSVFADETFKCRKETYIYNYKYAVHRGEEYSEEFSS